MYSNSEPKSPPSVVPPLSLPSAGGQALHLGRGPGRAAAPPQPRLRRPPLQLRRTTARAAGFPLYDDVVVAAAPLAPALSISVSGPSSPSLPRRSSPPSMARLPPRSSSCRREAARIQRPHVRSSNPPPRRAPPASVPVERCRLPPTLPCGCNTQNFDFN